MLPTALRVAGRGVATVVDQLPTRRDCARFFGTLERHLQPEQRAVTDGGRDRRPRQERRTTYQQPWLVAHDTGCERWDGDREYAQSELRTVVTGEGAILVHKDHVHATEHLDAAAARVTSGGGAADYVDAFPMIRAGPNSMVDLGTVAESDVPLEGIRRGGQS
jgi:hypothetical protein